MPAYISESNILNQSWVNLGTSKNLLEKGVDNVIQRGVLESTLLGLGQWSTDSKSDDDIVSVLGGAVTETVSFTFNVDRRQMSIEHRGWAYMALSPEEPGVMCLRMEERRSVMFAVLDGMIWGIKEWYRGEIV